MKIEMGESLFYSWLRHVKECQLVQTNWKVSPKWTLRHEEELERLMKLVDGHFHTQYRYSIFKQNSSLAQIIQQGECDAVGISIQNGENSIYAVDVAFHGAGLNYGTKEDTVMKVIAKSARTAMSLYGYMEAKAAEIIFASPKINQGILNDLIPCIEELNDLFSREGYGFKVRLIANEEFESSVLKPILLISDGISDTSELFIRSYQMFKMFDNEAAAPKGVTASAETVERSNEGRPSEEQEDSVYRELKVGKLAQIVLGRMREEGRASEEEIRLLQDAAYSKRTFDLQYPLLTRADGEYEKVRYYAKPLNIRGVKYVLCSQWFEKESNNDRPYLLRWIKSHQE